MPREPDTDEAGGARPHSAGSSDSVHGDGDSDSVGTAIDPLRTQWRALVSPDDRPFDALLRRHRERHRRYHTVDHVTAVVGLVTELSDVESVVDPGAALAAAWYHDAVYEPRSPSNERASARLARRDLVALGWLETRAAAVGAIVEGTATHLDPPDVDTAVMFDADLAILGSRPDDYDRYVGRVRDEYDHVDDDAWVSGRTGVLQGFLLRNSIYATETGRERWERSARANLERELASLEP